MVRSNIEDYYRKHDDFRRYIMSNERRVKELSELYLSNRKYFGHRILDLACGGGVLGFVVERYGHTCTGVDVNRDMIHYARAYVKKIESKNRFVLADIGHECVKGRFDTATLLGNALCHFYPADFLETLRNVSPALVRGAHFLIDYRDIVSLLFQREWKPKLVEKDEERTIVSRTKMYDAEKGNLIVESSWEDGSNRIEFTHAIWAPFIIEPIMKSNGWELIHRENLPKWTGWLDIYEKVLNGS